MVVVLGFYVSPTAKVIRRRDLGLKSHPKDWRIRGKSNRKAMNRNWSNQKANPALKTKTGNK